MLKFQAKQSDPKYAIHCANGFVEYFKVLSQQNDLEKYLAKLNLFTQARSYGLCLPVIADLKCEEFDVKNWLHKITTNLMELINRQIDISNDDQRKILYLKLSQAVLFVINTETKHSITNKIACDYAESQHFLNNCMELSCFSSSSVDPQYLKCFRFLNQFVLGLSFTKNETEDNSKLIDSMKGALKRLK